MSFIKSMMPSIFNCPYCAPKNAYKTPYHFSNHLKNKHPEMRQPVSSSKEDLIKFLEASVIVDEKLNCLEKNSRTITDLKSKSKSIYECLYCSKTYKMEYHFRNHIARKHPETLHKTVSSEQKLTESNKQSNIRSISSNLTIAKLGFSCPQCPKTYKTKYHFNNHIANKHPKCQKSESFSDQGLDENSEASAENSFEINVNENYFSNMITKRFDTFNSSFILLIGEIKDLKITIIELHNKIADLELHMKKK
jgi:hypothetical protein